LFEKGQLYRRDDLHLNWGGSTRLQGQGGILTPREAPLIIVVTGEEGGQYGYADEWDSFGVFHYYGAGQVGDMVFQRGNLALRDHAFNGEDVHLFGQDRSGLRYVGQMVGAGYDEIGGVPDVNGDPRRAIVFRLVPIEYTGGTTAPPDLTAESSPADARWTLSMEELRNRASRTVGRQPRAREGKRTAWERSIDLKIYVRRRAAGSCEGCGSQAPFTASDGHPYLEPHHTRRLSDGGPDDFHHVIALCPTCHRRVHHGADGTAYNELLKETLLRLETIA
jgi:5-methylcytosine-specific restriction protein A